MPIILALRKWRQKDLDFKTNLGYKVKLSQKTKSQKSKKKVNKEEIFLNIPGFCCYCSSARYQCCRPVILATWEAEIWRILVQGQSMQIV
jgi:hypothetical protein